jgi:hypothetical protein
MVVGMVEPREGAPPLTTSLRPASSRPAVVVDSATSAARYAASAGAFHSAKAPEAMRLPWIVT